VRLLAASLAALAMVTVSPSTVAGEIPVRAAYGYGQIRYAGHGPEFWHYRYTQARRNARAHWRSTVSYALRLASDLYHVPYWQMRSQAWCESRFDPTNVTPPYSASGLLQFLPGTWREQGLPRFSVFDPVANALAAARIVSREGWRQWECKPG
jgi:hypothetical protein